MMLMAVLMIMMIVRAIGGVMDGPINARVCVFVFVQRRRCSGEGQGKWPRNNVIIDKRNALVVFRPRHKKCIASCPLCGHIHHSATHFSTVTYPYGGRVMHCNNHVRDAAQWQLFSI